MTLSIARVGLLASSCEVAQYRAHDRNRDAKAALRGTVLAYLSLPDAFHDRIQCRYCAGMFVAEIKDGRARTVSAANLVLDVPANFDAQLSADLKEACAC